MAFWRRLFRRGVADPELIGLNLGHPPIPAGTTSAAELRAAREAALPNVRLTWQEMVAGEPAGRRVVQLWLTDAASRGFGHLLWGVFEGIRPDGGVAMTDTLEVFCQDEDMTHELVTHHDSVVVPGDHVGGIDFMPDDVDTWRDASRHERGGA